MSNGYILKKGRLFEVRALEVGQVLTAKRKQSKIHRNTTNQLFCNFVHVIKASIDDMERSNIYLVNPANFVRKSLKSFEGHSASRYI